MEKLNGKFKGSNVGAVTTIKMFKNGFLGLTIKQPTPFSKQVSYATTLKGLCDGSPVPFV